MFNARVICHKEDRFPLKGYENKESFEMSFPRIPVKGETISILDRNDHMQAQLFRVEHILFGTFSDMGDNTHTEIYVVPIKWENITILNED